VPAGRALELPTVLWRVSSCKPPRTPPVTAGDVPPPNQDPMTQWFWAEVPGPTQTRASQPLKLAAVGGIRPYEKGLGHACRSFVAHGAPGRGAFKDKVEG